MKLFYLLPCFIVCLNIPIVAGKGPTNTQREQLAQHKVSHDEAQKLRHLFGSKECRDLFNGWFKYVNREKLLGMPIEQYQKKLEELGFTVLGTINEGESAPKLDPDKSLTVKHKDVFGRVFKCASGKDSGVSNFSRILQAQRINDFAQQHHLPVYVVEQKIYFAAGFIACPESGAVVVAQEVDLTHEQEELSPEQIHAICRVVQAIPGACDCFKRSNCIIKKDKLVIIDSEEHEPVAANFQPIAHTIQCLKESFNVPDEQLGMLYETLHKDRD